MKESVERTVSFSEEQVERWCRMHRDENKIHTDEDEAAASMFGQRVVPGIMLLSTFSGMLTELGEDGETVILAGITAARFRDPVFFDEMVSLSVEPRDGSDSNNITPVDFEARVESRDTLVTNGVINIVIE